MKLKGATLIAKIAMALATQTLQQIVGTQIVSLQQAQQSIVKEMCRKGDNDHHFLHIPVWLR